MAASIRHLLVRATQTWGQTRKQGVAITGMKREMSTGYLGRNAAPGSPDAASIESQPTLDDKVAIISGGAGVIGTATAKLFAAHGAQVIVTDVRDEQGEKTAREIGQNAIYRHCDVTKEEDISSTVDFAVREFGKLDIMHNNAAVYPSLENFWTLDMDTYDRCTAINVRGVLLGMKHAARVMVPAKTGVILNTASFASVRTGNIVSLIYNLNKMNHPGLTQAGAFHLGKHGIRVNCISPITVPTDMTLALAQTLSPSYAGLDLPRLAELFAKVSNLKGRSCNVGDVANAALFLCSDDAAYISGQNLLVDGGEAAITSYDPFNIGEPAKLRDY